MTRNHHPQGAEVGAEDPGSAAAEYADPAGPRSCEKSRNDWSALRRLPRLKTRYIEASASAPNADETGQKPCASRRVSYIEAAKRRSEALDHVLIVGPGPSPAETATTAPAYGYVAGEAGRADAPDARVTVIDAPATGRAG